ncbi:MAG TPA: GNAT family N-acetyltransferase [Terriglobales bacterium]|nr:GNAT family N-acetyltransferase [Terriglobales bacterium]
MRVEWRREIPDDEALRQRWNALASAMEHPEVFYTYEWAAAVQRAYGKQLVPLLALCYEGECLVGVASLATDSSDRNARFLSSTTADYCDFISHPEQRRAVIQAVMKELAGLKIEQVTLANLPADSASAPWVRVVGTNTGYHTFSRPAYLCARVRLGSAEQRSELQRLALGRKVLRRQQNSLGKEGPLRLRHLNDWDEIQKALPHYSIQHVARFLSTQRLSNLIRPERRLFVQELARLLSGSGWMMLTQLVASNRPVAWNYGFRYAGSWFWYQPTFDSSLERHSPGFCLLSKMVSEACDDESILCFDMGLGDEGYKERLATSSRQTLHITCHQSEWQHLRGVVRYHVARVAKASPSREERIRAAYVTISELMGAVRKPGWRALPARVLHRCRGYWREEVVFFNHSPAEEMRAGSQSEGMVLRKVDLEMLATAAMHYADDPETLTYLLRCASRLRTTRDEGFALVKATGVAVHFCWTGPFEGFFISELKTSLQETEPDSYLIFDCWTPLQQRRRGYYSLALRMLARRLQLQGKRPWVFCAASNQGSTKGIENAGFERRYTVTRHRLRGTKRKDIDGEPSSMQAGIPQQAVNLQYESSGRSS